MGQGSEEEPWLPFSSRKDRDLWIWSQRSEGWGQSPYVSPPPGFPPQSKPPASGPPGQPLPQEVHVPQDKVEEWQADQAEAQRAEGSNDRVTPKVQHAVHVRLSVHIGEATQPEEQGKEQVEDPRRQQVNVVNQVHRCGGEEELQEHLSAVDYVEVDAEGSDRVAGHRVVDGPVEEGHHQGEGADEHLEQPLQPQGQSQRRRSKAKQCPALKPDT